LKAGGQIKRGWLGVRIQNVDEKMVPSLGLSEPKGALVAEVTTPGPAARAGIKRGDAILSVNGVKVADSRDLARQIAGFQPDTTVEVKLMRAQKETTVQVKLGLLPSAEKLDAPVQHVDRRCGPGQYFCPGKVAGCCPNGWGCGSTSCIAPKGRR